MSPQERRAFALLAASLLVLGCLGFSCARSAHAAASIPRAAEQYRPLLVRSAQNVFGLNAPIAVLAAQIHQESGWDASARSVYASGLAQFTPATAQTMARLYPSELRAAAPSSPAWALLALCRYDQQLYRAAAYAATDSDRWAFTLSGYNGGPGWVSRDRARAKAQGLDASRWWGQVETVNAGRAPQFFRENRGYPRRILVVILPMYEAAGWGLGVRP